jgi:hypothetical protein
MSVRYLRVEFERRGGVLFGRLQAEMMPQAEWRTIDILTRQRAVDALFPVERCAGKREGCKQPSGKLSSQHGPPLMGIQIHVTAWRRIAVGRRQLVRRLSYEPPRPRAQSFAGGKVAGGNAA